MFAVVCLSVYFFWLRPFPQIHEKQLKTYFKQLLSLFSANGMFHRLQPKRYFQSGRWHFILQNLKWQRSAHRRYSAVHAYNNVDFVVKLFTIYIISHRYCTCIKIQLQFRCWAKYVWTQYDIIKMSKNAKWRLIEKFPKFPKFANFTFDRCSFRNEWNRWWILRR